MGAGSIAALGVGVLQSGFNAWLGNEMQNIYMNNWGSPEAQMEHMVRAGVNPYSVAGRLSGVAGDTNIGSTIGGYDLNNSIAALANSQMNPTIEDNTKSGTKKNDADAKVAEAVAEGQEIQNEINGDTKDNQKQEIRDRARKMGYDADVADVTAKYADDIQKATLSNLDADYNAKVKQVELDTKQIEKLDKDIEEINENIKVLKEQVKFYKSEEEKNAAEAALAREEKKKVEKEKEKLQIENEISDLAVGDDLNAQYYRIRNKYGKEFADKWLEDAKQINSDYEYSIEEGKSQGKNAGDVPFDYEKATQTEVLARCEVLKQEYAHAEQQMNIWKNKRNRLDRDDADYDHCAEQVVAWQKKMDSYDNEYRKLRRKYNNYDWWKNKNGKNSTLGAFSLSIHN